MSVEDVGKINITKYPELQRDFDNPLSQIYILEPTGVSRVSAKPLLTLGQLKFTQRNKISTLSQLGRFSTSSNGVGKILIGVIERVHHSLGTYYSVGSEGYLLACVPRIEGDRIPEIPPLPISSKAKEVRHEALEHIVEEITHSTHPQKAHRNLAVFESTFGIRSHRPHTNTEIAERYEITNSRVGQIKDRYLRRFSKYLDLLYPFVAYHDTTIPALIGCNCLYDLNQCFPLTDFNATNLGHVLKEEEIKLLNSFIPGSQTRAKNSRFETFIREVPTYQMPNMVREKLLDTFTHLKQN